MGLGLGEGEGHQLALAVEEHELPGAAAERDERRCLRCLRRLVDEYRRERAWLEHLGADADAPES